MKIEKFIFYIFLANFTLISAFGVLETYKEASVEVKNPFEDPQYKLTLQDNIDGLEKARKDLEDQKANELKKPYSEQRQKNIEDLNIELGSNRNSINYAKKRLANYLDKEKIYKDPTASLEEKEQAVRAAQKILGLAQTTTVIGKSRGLMSDDIKAFKNLVDVSRTSKIPFALDIQKVRSKRIIDLSTLAKNIVKEAQARASELLGDDFINHNQNITKQLKRITSRIEGDKSLDGPLNYALSDFYRQVDLDESRIHDTKTGRQAYLSRSAKIDLLENELNALNEKYSTIVQSSRKVSSDNVIFPDQLSLDALINFNIYIKK